MCSKLARVGYGWLVEGLVDVCVCVCACAQVKKGHTQYLSQNPNTLRYYLLKCVAVSPPDFVQKRKQSNLDKPFAWWRATGPIDPVYTNGHTTDASLNK